MSRDLRLYANRTNIGLLIGFIVILFLVGDGLIYLLYGREASLMGLICLLLGLAPGVLIWLLLSILAYAVRKMNE